MLTDSMYAIALHAEMREGLLAESTDYVSKPLRDQLKRTRSDSLFSERSSYSWSPRGGLEGQSGFSSRSRKCEQGPEAQDNSRRVRTIQILLQSAGLDSRVYASGMLKPMLASHLIG